MIGVHLCSDAYVSFDPPWSFLYKRRWEGADNNLEAETGAG
jgi:hypothetical protein